MAVMSLFNIYCDPLCSIIQISRVNSLKNKIKISSFILKKIHKILLVFKNK